jgi:hypothetical protein
MKMGLDHWLEAHDFIVQQLFELFTANIVLVEIELEEFGIERGSDWFVIGVVLLNKMSVDVSRRGRN